VSAARRRRVGNTLGNILQAAVNNDSRSVPVAYFSMEIALAAGIPTYAGGLGVLAGDTLRSAADLGVDLIAVTLLHRKGYFRQRLDGAGHQFEEDEQWRVEDFMIEQAVRAAVRIEGRTVRLRCWQFAVRGVVGSVPVYCLDADLPENSEQDRALTDHLYGGDSRYRLCQEIILGIGGVRMLRALGYERIRRFHMNEGHSSLLVLELLEERARASGRAQIGPEEIEAVRRTCVFTTHTPIASGVDQYELDMADRILGPNPLASLQDRCCANGLLNLTLVGHRFSHYVNGVAMKNAEIERRLLNDSAIDAITNGVHAASWTAPEFQELFDRHIPGWRRDNFSLRYALSIPLEEIRAAHAGAKRRLLERVQAATGTLLRADAFTIGFARRATAYKRADLLMHDLDRLKVIGAEHGPLQVIYAGKAHPQDDAGKVLIESVYRARAALQGQVAVVYLENYDIELAGLLTAGVDLWLNTPMPPLEASGTSGMKAALNGVPSLSVLDGWWIEGHIEGVTGWSIGEASISEGDRNAEDAASIYRKLETTVLPLFHSASGYGEVMRRAIALNGSFFNSQRMMEEYEHKAYAD
jgi:starch phosphorylase